MIFNPLLLQTFQFTNFAESIQEEFAVKSLVKLPPRYFSHFPDFCDKWFEVTLEPLKNFTILRWENKWEPDAYSEVLAIDHQSRQSGCMHTEIGPFWILIRRCELTRRAQLGQGYSPGLSRGSLDNRLHDL